MNYYMSWAELVGLRADNPGPLTLDWALLWDRSLRLTFLYLPPC
jgi:hypothetical protein